MLLLLLVMLLLFLMLLLYGVAVGEGVVAVIVAAASAVSASVVNAGVVSLLLLKFTECYYFCSCRCSISCCFCSLNRWLSHEKECNLHSSPSSLTDFFLHIDFTPALRAFTPHSAPCTHTRHLQAQRLRDFAAGACRQSFSSFF